MFQRKWLWILAFLLLIGGNTNVLAKNEDHFQEMYWKPQSIEHQYKIMGYLTKDVAVKQFEKLYQKTVNLPKHLPSIEITHSFGIIDSYSYPPKLEVEYVNENQPKEQIKLFIIPVDQGIYNKAPIAQLFVLEDGKTAKQLKDRSHNILIFHKGGWEYILASNKKIEEKVSIEDLVEMANSIETKG